MRFFLIGFMGSGKTYWAKQWSEAFGLSCYDLDEEIEKKAGMTIAEIFQKKGENGFRKIEQQVLTSFFEKDDFILSCGGGTPCFFDNMKQMNRNGVTIFLNSSVEELVSRVKNEKETRPLIKDLADEVLDQYIGEKLQQRLPYYSKAMYHFHTRFLSNDNFERLHRRHAK